MIGRSCISLITNLESSNVQEYLYYGTVVCFCGEISICSRTIWLLLFDESDEALHYQISNVLWTVTPFFSFVIFSVTTAWHKMQHHRGRMMAFAIQILLSEILAVHRYNKKWSYFYNTSKISLIQCPDKSLAT